MAAAPIIDDLSQWLNINQVTARLQISPRTVHRRADEGKLHPRKRPVAGGSPENVYDPREVEALIVRPAEAAAPAINRENTLLAMSLPPMTGLPPMAEATQIRPAAESQPAVLAAFISLMVDQAFARREAKEPTTYATLDEAAAATGLSWNLLRKAIREGKLQGVRDGAIKVHRDDLGDLNLDFAAVKDKKQNRKKVSRG